MRAHADYVLTNPDMLHRALLPGARARGPRSCARCAYVVVDECHVYRGVFGSHVAAVLRRLRRVAAPATGPSRSSCSPPRRSPDPAASAGAADRPARERGDRGRLAARRRVDLRAVGAAADRRARRAWRPGAPHRDRGDRRPAGRPGGGRGAHAGLRPLPARRRDGGAARPGELLAEVDRLGLAGRVAAYRAGYLPRGAPRAGGAAARRRGRSGWPPRPRWSSGSTSPGSTRCCWPATRARGPRCGSRPAGPGRHGARRWPCSSPATTRWTPIWCTTPRRCSDRPVEATVLDPDNPYVLAPAPGCGRRRAAADRRPTCDLFGPASARAGSRSRRRGLLRRRPGRLVLDRPGSGPSTWPTCAATGGAPVAVVEAATGRLLGTVDRGSAHTHGAPGALYLHQGESYRRTDAGRGRRMSPWCRLRTSTGPPPRARR